MKDSASSSFDFDNFIVTSATSSTASVVGTDSDSCSLSMIWSNDTGGGSTGVGSTATDGGGTDGDDDGVATGNTSIGCDVDFFIFLTVSGSTSIYEKSATVVTTLCN